MKNRAPFITLSIIILLIWGVLSYFLFICMNDLRIAGADSLYREAVTEANPQNRAILLIQSNLLNSSTDKQYQIAEAALESNNTELAQQYIDYLENEQVKDELNVYIKFSRGDYETAEKLGQPLTSLGKLVAAIVNNSYTNIRGDSSYIFQINQLPSNLSEFERGIRVAKIFSTNNQHYLSLYVLDGIIEEHQCNVAIYKLKADDYEALGKYENAIGEVESALECDISDEGLYEKAINYSQILGNTAKKSLYIDRLEYIRSISD